jgi:hypothetical protein
MKICSHVIRSDTGLAPNPFHGYCTTALCTPSHMNARLQPGDWLIGHSPRAEGNRLVYAMHLAEVLTMENYFHDVRFQAKKPKPLGSPRTYCEGAQRAEAGSGSGCFRSVRSAYRSVPSSRFNGMYPNLSAIA